jgi:hypothetical protein
MALRWLPTKPIDFEASKRNRYAPLLRCKMSRMAQSGVRCGAKEYPLLEGLCCKSRKLQIYKFFAKTQNGKQSPIRITSIALPKSPVSL